ncbi:hypothetical protein [Paraherbaspirillum soli]|uniref:SDR family oxidoreductase n=1 Tax=Paraherbaspirillum soli TaxID=631222 RepID=A0ABW0M6Q5_9BURK
MTPSETVLILDADTILGRALCDELRSAGYRVIAHTRAEPDLPFASDVIHQIAPLASDRIADWNQAWGPLSHVMIGQREHREMGYRLEDQAEELMVALQEQLSHFLLELQSSAQVLMRNDGGQIWVITQDDSMQHYLSMPAMPIVTRARHAAVKSFAKEVLRLGVRINCATVQLLAEQAEPDAWREARDGLKAFAMKFKPIKAAAVACTLRGWLAQKDLPLAGMVVPLGVGFSENNI